MTPEDAQLRAPARSEALVSQPGSAAGPVGRLRELKPMRNLVLIRFERLSQGKQPPNSRAGSRGHSSDSASGEMGPFLGQGAPGSSSIRSSSVGRKHLPILVASGDRGISPGLHPYEPSLVLLPQPGTTNPERGSGSEQRGGWCCLGRRDEGWWGPQTLAWSSPGPAGTPNPAASSGSGAGRCLWQGQPPWGPPLGTGDPSEPLSTPDRDRGAPSGPGTS